MSRFRELCLLIGLSVAALGSSGATAADSPRFPGIGRDATAQEVKAWDIDVRPDFQGLPPGSGSVAQGQDIWEAKCASCHGIFGESNEVFTPLIGGTTADDVKTGRVARLLDRGYPSRTLMMKVPTVSTLWDFIRRAMPWNAPKSLSPDEVYATTAFLLNLAGVVPDPFTLSDKNIAEVQQRMPNRNGVSRAHGLWPGAELGGTGRPDVRATACMSNCVTEPKISSFLPAFARNAHGNLAEQNRAVGAQHGADTTRPEGAPPTATAATAASPGKAAMSADGTGAKAAMALMQKNGCLACHQVDKKLVGPPLLDVAKKYAGKADALRAKVRAGSVGAWGPIAMPAQTLPDADLATIAQWLAAGAPRP